MEVIVSIVHVLIYFALLFVPKDVDEIVIDGPSPAESIHLNLKDGHWLSQGKAVEISGGNLVGEGNRIPMKEEILRAWEKQDWARNPLLSLADSQLSFEKKDDGFLFIDHSGGAKREYRIRYVTVVKAAPPASLDSSAAISINVLGEVNNPGAYTVPANASLLDAVAAAGGWTKQANTKKVSLVRGAAGTTPKVTFHNMGILLEGQGVSPPLQKGDTIYLKERLF